MKSRIVFFLGCFLLAIFTQPIFAAKLATPEQDRRAKQATPPAGKALIYVYRLDAGARGLAPSVWLNGRDSGRLEPNTYGMWAAGVGRLAIRAGQAKATPLTFTCAAGRVYFVHLTVNKDKTVSLRQVPYATGRKEMHKARLVLDPVLASRAVAPAKPPARGPVQPAPVAKKPAVAKEVDDDESEARSGATLIFKVGSFNLANKSQSILGSTRSFSAANIAYGLEGEWHFEHGLALGVEVFGHSQNYTTAGFTGEGEMAVTNLMFNVKKYFRPAAVVQPYVGAGIGSAATKFSAGSSSGTSGLTGGATGFAVQGMAGVAFRWRHVGIYTEFKYERAETEGSNAITGASESVNASGTGLFAGMSVQF